MFHVRKVGDFSTFQRSTKSVTQCFPIEKETFFCVLERQIFIGENIDVTESTPSLKPASHREKVRAHVVDIETGHDVQR